MQVPELRFKEFNDEWNNTYIRNIFEERSQKHYQYLELLSVTIDNGVIKRCEISGKNTSSDDKSNYKLVEINDIVYNSMRMWQGASGVSKYKGIVSPAYTILKPKININSNFFGYMFKLPNMIYHFRVNSQGLTSDTWNLKYTQIKDIPISLPSIEEQTKIANFLSLIDRKIELQEKLVENLNLYKKGLLKKVFSNNLGWKTAKLSKYFDITSSKRVFQSEWTNNGIPFYRAREIVKLVNNNYIDNELFISKSMYDEYSKKYGKIQKNDLLITGVGTIGICYLVKETDEFYFKDGNLIWLKPKNNNINSKFVKYLFQSNYIINQINNFGNGTTVATYTIDNANETKIFIPSIEEQNRIANLFTSLDKKIELETKKLQDLKTYKKGLLQKMFI